jgi:hypothetical protein
LFERLAIDWLGAASQTAVAERLSLSWEPSQWFNLDGRPHLQGHEIPPPHLDRYASLLPGGAQ